MKKPILVLWLTSIVFVGILIATYGYLNNFVFDGLINPLWLLVNVFYPFAMDFLTTYNLQGTTNMLVVGGTALGLFLAIIALIKGIVTRRYILGIASGLAVGALFVYGVSLIIVTPELTQGRFVYFLLDGFTTNGVNTLFLVALLGFIYLVLFLTFLLGITSQKPNKQKAVQDHPASALPPLSGQPATAATFSPTPSIQPNASTQSADNLSELVKVVMAEELNLLRANQPIYPTPGYPQPMNVYPPMDANMIRRIVAEELAKFQSHYISRPEVQTLIAQEISNLKIQLKIK
jgi:hypothetical protein